MKAVTVAAFLACSIAYACAVPCTSVTGQAGLCVDASTCKTTSVSGRCAGAANIKCCLNAAAAPAPSVTPTPTTPATAIPCTDLAGNPGSCMNPSSCTTTTVSGRCAGATAKCCMKPVVLPANAAEAVGKTMYFNLRSQAFPGNGYAGAAVYVPKAYQPNGPLNVVVFIHGFVNCIQNVLRPVGSNSVCTPGNPARAAYGLIDQIEATGKNVLLVAAETARDQNSGANGNLGKPNGLKNFLDELLNESLAPVLGARRVTDINRLIVFGHSAAYQSTSAFAAQSGVPQLREIHLLDSLYGNEAMYNTWIKAHAKEFANGNYRFSNTYYSSTATNSVGQAGRVKSIVPSSVFLWESKGVTPTTAMFATPVLFKASSVHSHDGIPANFVGPLLAQSPI